MKKKLKNAGTSFKRFLPGNEWIIFTRTPSKILPSLIHLWLCAKYLLLWKKIPSIAFFKIITVSRPSTSLRVFLMEGSGFPNRGVQRGAPTYAQNFKNPLLPSLNVSLNQKVESTLSFMLSIPALVTDHILKKGIFNRI